MQKEKEYDCQDLESTSQETNSMPIGSDQIWLEAPDRLKGLASFQTNLPEINILTDFIAEPPRKKSNKIEVHVRRKDDPGSLF